MKHDSETAERTSVISSALNIVGESPLWDEKRWCLWCVDVYGKRLRKIRWADKTAQDVVLPFVVGFICLDRNGELMGGAHDGVYRYLRRQNRWEKASRPFRLKGERLNDGKPGPDGRLYMGTFSRDFSAAFYRMDSDGTMTELMDGVGNSNGLAWSPDCQTLYFNDTPTRTTAAFDFDSAAGSISNRRVIARYDHGRPDGMTIDREGNLLVALWGGGEIVRVDPRCGREIEHIGLPVSQPSSCAFAGAGMNELVITTAAHGVAIKDEPLAGAVFCAPMRIGGERSFRFAG